MVCDRQCRSIGAAMEESGEVMMLRNALRVIAIVLNVCAAVYWFSYALAWGQGDYLAGTIAALPPILAVAALVYSQPKRVMTGG